MDKLFYDENGITVRRSVMNDVQYLSKHLRQADINEIWASHHYMPYDALKEGLEKSIFCLTVQNGNPIAMFGINPDSILGQRATVWMLGTNDLDKIKTRFAKNSRKFINMFLDYYPYLYNWIDVRNTKSIDWLKFCGANFSDPAPFGEEKLLFQSFSFERKI